MNTNRHKILQKVELRRLIKEKRKELGSKWIKAASAEITNRLLQLDEFLLAKTVGLYMEIGGEVELSSLFKPCWQQVKRTCIPVFNNTERVYDFAEITEQTKFQTGHYGISEPESPSLASINEIDLMIIPGVAFDAGCNRLGRGGGYYDRILSDFTGVSIAVAFDFQIVPEVPLEPTDLPVDLIITEKRIIKSEANIRQID